ncbi:stage III sporulation protein SpoAB [Clostridium sp. cel8]|jgi:stage III sporulation protein AB|uniref:stage III sporulation protein SpoIIIAB n=1 Tax=Clostridium sp. cel8 TaxID=2663123 RepID=UPI0015F52FC1|nr:stage III sporulation protein SpoIIIAB [Clostridium sp. cel8]MBA5850621.1 stage III sporulation protein SpoAB [Clostridium sp. cel8]
MIKLLGCIMVIFSTTAIGFILGEKLKNRTRELRELQRCIYEIKTRILYSHTTLPQAIATASTKVKRPVSTLFMEVSKMLNKNSVNNVYQAFESVFADNRDIFNLKDEDISIILDFSKSLGESDLEGQKSIFSLTIENLKKQIDMSEVILKKNIKMYRYLGFSLGAVVVILLI